MKLGCQSAPTNAAHVAYFARYGVEGICGYPETAPGHLYATVDELKRLRELAEKYRVSLDCIAPPFLESTHIDKEKHPAVMLADSPQRDRDIEDLQVLIRNCAAAGIPAIKYNLNLLGVLRTGRDPGRGDATYSAWRLAGAHPENPLTRAGHVNADSYWERITYFLERVIPVAEEYKAVSYTHLDGPEPPNRGHRRSLGGGGRLPLRR